MALTAIHYTFSQEANSARKSLIRELMAKAVDPTIISFAAGLPAGELLPVAELQECVSAVLARDGARALQYSPQWRPLREWIAEHMRGRGVVCTVDNIFITNGSQQGLTILSRLFLDSGEPAVIETATFTGIHLITGGRGALVRGIPTDLQTGADMMALEKAFAERPRPRLAVLIPDFHNPLGVSMTDANRQRAAQLSNDYEVPLIEDDPYSLLRFTGQPKRPIKAYDESGTVFYLGSFSKMLAPGLRLGWIVAPAELIPKITTLREAIDLESSTLIQRAVMEFLSRGLLEPHLARLNAENGRRCFALLDALDQYMSDYASWTQPDGGLFIWATLPPNMDTLALLQEAIAEKVVYIPGIAFTDGNNHHNALRLNFSNLAPQQIYEGIARLDSVIRRHL